MPQGETRYEKDGQAGLGVADLAALDEGHDLRQGLGRHLDELVRLAGMLARSQIRCPKKVNLLVGKAGRRPYSRKTLYPPRFHTDFFEQLPLCTYPWIFARIQPPSRDFIQVVERRVA